MLQLEVGKTFEQRALLRRLVEMQYNRNEWSSTAAASA
jgi:excinuclease UvrABC helicase subunit UvrB